MFLKDNIRWFVCFTGGVFVLFSSLQSCSFRVTIEINLIFGLCHYEYALRLRLRGG